MNLQHLRAFVTIAQLGSFTKAAAVLDYAQSSISAQIHFLENELDTKLFERSGRVISLTEEGKKFFLYAQKLLKLEDEAKESLAKDIEPSGTLTIGAPESLCIFWLPSILQEYRKWFPKVKLIMKLGSCCDIYDWLRKNIIDVAFLLDTPNNDPKFVREIISREKIVLIACIDHPLTQKSFCEPEDIADEDIILIDEGECCYRTVFESQLKKSDIHPGSVQEIGSVEMIKKFVMTGLGISILPYIAVEKEVVTGQLKDLYWNGGDFNIYTQMIYKKDKWFSPNLSELTKIVQGKKR